MFFAWRSSWPAPHVGGPTNRSCWCCRRRWSSQASRCPRTLLGSSSGPRGKTTAIGAWESYRGYQTDTCARPAGAAWCCSCRGCRWPWPWRAPAPATTCRPRMAMTATHHQHLDQGHAGARNAGRDGGFHNGPGVGLAGCALGSRQAVLDSEHQRAVRNLKPATRVRTSPHDPSARFTLNGSMVFAMIAFTRQTELL